MTTKYRSRRARLAALRDDLRAQGWTWREIARRIAREEHVNIRVAFRLAHGMSQRDVAVRWNEQFPPEADSAGMNDKVISYWENWPQSGHEASLKSLKRLACIYQCSVGDLVDDGDFSGLDAAKGNEVIRPAAGRTVTDARKESGSKDVRPATAQPGPGQEQLAGHVFHRPDAAEIDDMNRRELLRIMSVAGTLLAMGTVRDSVDWDRLDYFARRSLLHVGCHGWQGSR